MDQSGFGRGEKVWRVGGEPKKVGSPPLELRPPCPPPDGFRAGSPSCQFARLRNSQSRSSLTSSSSASHSSSLTSTSVSHLLDFCLVNRTWRSIAQPELLTAAFLPDPGAVESFAAALRRMPPSVVERPGRMVAFGPGVPGELQWHQPAVREGSYEEDLTAILMNAAEV